MSNSVNYRKRKKFWTTSLRKLNEKLKASGNPFNAVLNWQIKYVELNIKALKDMKDANKNTKTA